MLISETVTTVILVVVGLFTTAALYFGLLGMLGWIDVVRCASCHHLCLSFSDGPPHQCRRCRHPAHLHALALVRTGRHGDRQAPFPATRS